MAATLCCGVAVLQRRQGEKTIPAEKKNKKTLDFAWCSLSSLKTTSKIQPELKWKCLCTRELKMAQSNYMPKSNSNTICKTSLF